MTNYWMTAYNHSTTGYWEPCRSRTLRDAKAEATRELGRGYTDDELRIAADRDRPNDCIVSRKADHKWVDDPMLAHVRPGA